MFLPMLVYQNSKLRQITCLAILLRFLFSTVINRIKFIKSHSCILFALMVKRELEEKEKQRKMALWAEIKTNILEK